MQELQGEFLGEVTFLLETYEESMLLLESGTEPAEQLTQIFRVAHSVKGGAAAVGFPDLSKFAHVVEDLLSLLRNTPTLVNSEIISLLLKSGDELKKRIEELKSPDAGAWDTTALKEQLKACIESINTKPKAQENPENIIPFDTPSVAATASAEPAEDVTNYDLLNELLSQIPAEDAAEFRAKEEKANAPVAQNRPVNEAPVEVSEPVAEVLAKGPKKAASNQKQSTNQTIKVDTSRIDSVLDAMGELVVLKNQIVHDETVRNAAHPHLADIVDQLDKAVRELYDKTLSIRMTPLKSLFVKIQRIVRDVSITLDKPIDLHFVGEETEVERTVFELLNDPLVHLVRNAMDHGIENKASRQQKGKPVLAQLTVSAKQSGNTVVIEIIDDGGGINREKVLGKAIEKGLIAANRDPATIPDEDVFKMIFAPGFSTADKISDLSGRGVGLDVVRANIEKVNGKINIFSKPGLGSTFRLTIPLTTAITDGIVVAMSGSRYIIPIHAIREIVRLQAKDFTHLDTGAKVAKIRGSLIPVINLGLGLHESTIMAAASTTDSHRRGDEIILVVIDAVSHVMAFAVDQVIGQMQVVVKPLTFGVTAHEVGGAAILGDGKTVLILDPNSIANEAFKESAA